MWPAAAWLATLPLGRHLVICPIQSIVSMTKNKSSQLLATSKHLVAELWLALVIHDVVSITRTCLVLPNSFLTYLTCDVPQGLV